MIRRCLFLAIAPALLCSSFLAPTAAADDPAAIERAVREEIDQARRTMIGARNVLESEQAVLDDVRSEWQAVRNKVDAAIREARARREHLEAFENLAGAVTRHADSQIAEWEAELERRRGAGESAARIADAENYVRAWRNQKENRLRRQGYTGRIEHHRRRLTEAEAAAEREALPLRIVEEQLQEQADRYEVARNAYDAALAAYLSLIEGAAERLEETSPPWLTEVTVTDSGGDVVYRAGWRSAEVALDAKIDILKRAMERQRGAIRASAERIAEWSDLLMEQNAVCDDLMARYQSAVRWSAWKTIFAEMADSAVTIARDIKTFGPYAFAVEAVSRVGYAVTGHGARSMDVLDLPGMRNAPDPAAGAGYSGVAVEAGIKNAIKKLLEAHATGAVGELAAGYYTNLSLRNPETWRVFRDADFWVLIEKETIGGIDMWVARETGLRQWLRQSPRQLGSAIKNQLKRPGTYAGLAADLAQAAGKEWVLREWADGPRLAAWNEYLEADVYRTFLRESLKGEGDLRRFRQRTLELMQEEMQDLLRQRDAAGAARELVILVNKTLEGEGTFTLQLDFSRDPIIIESVTLGGKAIEGELWRSVWTGAFDLLDMPEVATLAVDAIEPLSRKKLDDPETVARFAGTGSRWVGYEPGADTHHRLSLVPMSSGVAIVLLVDCSGSMREHNRMEGARQAARTVLDPQRLKPDDRIAIFAFFDCRDIRQMTPFTRDLDELSQAIDGLQPRSGTPLAAGIRTAGTYLHRAAPPGSRKHVLIVLTDGGESCDGDVYGALHYVRSLGVQVARGRTR